MGRKASGGMKLTKEDVLHVAKLANLELSETEVEKFQKQLSEVVDYVSQLSQVDTSGVETTGRATEVAGRIEEDEPMAGDGLAQEEATAGARRKERGCFVVPGILNKDL